MTRLGYPTNAASMILALGLCVACAGPESTTGEHSEQPPAEEFPIGEPETFLSEPFVTASLRSLDRIFPHRVVPASSAPHAFARAEEPLAIAYDFDGASHTLADFPERTGTTGLLILHRGRILHEAYFKGADETSRFLSMSVAKSFSSTLLGIARGEGLIESFDDPVERYLPELVGTGYEGVRIKDVLQMSTGIAFVEEYENPESDIARFGRACFGGRGGVRTNDLVATYGRAREPGEEFHYATVDTQIVGMLIARTTGRSLAAYMAEKLWEPLGAERDAYWILDREGDDGVECAGGGVNVSLRDYGRLGLLMAYDGLWQGERLLPEGWVAEATIPDAPHVQPGSLYPDYPMGYQYQWWTFPGDDHTFTGQGIHGQFLLVDPVLDLVVVKTSDWPTSWIDEHERETYALFEALRAELGG